MTGSEYLKSKGRCANCFGHGFKERAKLRGVGMLRAKCPLCKGTGRCEPPSNKETPNG